MPESLLLRVEQGWGSGERGDGAEAELCEFGSRGRGGQKVYFKNVLLLQVEKSIIQVANLSCNK